MAEAGKRPGTATAAAVIELIFSALAIIFVGIGGVIAFLTALGLAAIGGGLGVAGIIGLVQALAGLVFGVIGLIGSIMLLTNKKQGVGLSKAWVFGTLILFGLGIVSSVLSMSAVAAMADSFSSGDVNISMGAIGAGAVIIGIVLALLWQVAPAVVVLILLSQKPVKDFYAAAA